MKLCRSRDVLQRVLALGLAFDVAPLAAQGLDADSCAALRGQGQRFALSLASCPSQALPPAPAPRLLPRAAQAQQLHLFERATPVEPVLDQAQPAVPATRRPRQAAPARNPAALSRALQLVPQVQRVAEVHAIDPLLLHAIARVESRHDPAAVSPAGARGLMQLMPATGSRFGVSHAQQLHDVHTNLDVSARYLRLLDRRFQGQLPLVLAAYNAGEGAVERHGRRIPPFAETQAYVRQVLDEYTRLQAARESASP